MKKRSIFIGGAVIIMLFVISISGYADGYANKTVEGAIQTISTNVMRITDQAGNEAQLVIDQHTQFEGSSGVADFKEGDKVKIEYSENNSQKTAIMVNKLEDALQTTMPRV